MKFILGSRRILLTYALVLTMPVAFAVQARAELGGGTESVNRDRALFHAQEKVTEAGTHSIHEFNLTNGTRMREYVSGAGEVFAVSWVSPVRPDLKQLLGSHFSQYAQALQTKHVRRGPVVLRTDDLVVESAGHMRGFVGHAYIPSLMPAGVTVNDIQ